MSGRPRRKDQASSSRRGGRARRVTRGEHGPVAARTPPPQRLRTATRPSRPPPASTSPRGPRAPPARTPPPSPRSSTWSSSSDPSPQSPGPRPSPLTRASRQRWRRWRSSSTRRSGRSPARPPASPTARRRPRRPAPSAARRGRPSRENCHHTKRRTRSSGSSGRVDRWVAAEARSDRRPRSLVCVGRCLTPVRSRSSSERPTRPMRLSWVWFIPCGTRPRGEKWRSGRIVPLRTRPRCRQNRAITRKLPGASGVPTRTILPERQNPEVAGAADCPRPAA